jgi:hypothetical protein
MSIRPLPDLPQQIGQPLSDPCVNGCHGWGCGKLKHAVPRISFAVSAAEAVVVAFRIGYPVVLNGRFTA